MDPILPEPIQETGNPSPAQTEQLVNAQNTPTPQSVEPIMPPTNTQSAQVASPVAQPQPQQPQGSAPATDTPLIADDVDVIEKEWVDKAKKIVSATKSDPHTQEREVSKLQADYLMKRYNKKLKVNE